MFENVFQLDLHTLYKMPHPIYWGLNAIALGLEQTLHHRRSHMEFKGRPEADKLGPPGCEQLSGSYRDLAGDRLFRFGQGQAKDTVLEFGYDLALIDHLG